MNRTAQSGMIGFGYIGAWGFGLPGAIGGMILGALLGWWVTRAGGRPGGAESCSG